MTIEKYSSIKDDSILNLSNNQVIMNDFRIIKIFNNKHRKFKIKFHGTYSN